MRDWMVSLVTIGKMFGDSALAKFIVSSAMAAVSYLFPTAVLQEMAVSTFLMIIVDTVTGVAVAMQTGEAIASRKFSRVIYKIIGYGALLFVVSANNKYLPGGAGTQAATITVALTYILLSESISVLENIRKLGFTIPFGLDKWLKDRLIQKPEVRFVEKVEGQEVVVERVVLKEEVK